MMRNKLVILDPRTLHKGLFSCSLCPPNLYAKPSDVAPRQVIMEYVGEEAAKKDGWHKVRVKNGHKWVCDECWEVGRQDMVKT